jgi:hypothetical protein
MEVLVQRYRITCSNSRIEGTVMWARLASRSSSLLQSSRTVAVAARNGVRPSQSPLPGAANLQVTAQRRAMGGGGYVASVVLFDVRSVVSSREIQLSF